MAAAGRPAGVAGSRRRLATWLRAAAPLGRRPPGSGGPHADLAAAGRTPGRPSGAAAGSRAAGAARVGAAAPP
ncbi:hypothetical protein DMT42_11360 [Streptomyces actuosus]|uniref:Uncharacterized protein n=1 Tax=Streptomyces actuosus TaxID=1885 RepID=A0A2U9P014_STRAS|nr:hypothetical protein DMT42_11360 [Streptomyces actuosus]